MSNTGVPALLMSSQSRLPRQLQSQLAVLGGKSLLLYVTYKACARVGAFPPRRLCVIIYSIPVAALSTCKCTFAFWYLWSRSRSLPMSSSVWIESPRCRYLHLPPLRNPPKSRAGHPAPRTCFTPLPASRKSNPTSSSPISQRLAHLN